MKRVFYSLFVLLLISCSKESPINGLYQSKDGHLSAVIMDSTLFLMIGPDSMFIYELKIHSVVEYKEDTFRFYNVLFRKSLNRSGYELFNIPLAFEYDSLFGGVLIACFHDNNSFGIGGHYLYHQRDSNGGRIFNNWRDLYLNNRETYFRLKYPKDE